MDQFIVSARKYRPATFDMVVGQQAITSTLKNAIRNNILAQAFLFTGPRGVGKTTCARILAKTINCFHPSSEMEACDHCESCKSFNNSASFNIHELDAASNNSVDDIRNLVDQVRIPPQVGKYKIYIIDEVHMLSSAAFNAFLKTLEEPPSYAKFILATTEKHKIIPTILSRCQVFDFKRITNEDIVKQLQYVAEKEKVNAEYDALAVIAQKADGAMRDALSIFDQMLSYSGNEISYRAVIDNLNVLDYEYYFRITNSMLASDSASVLLMINEIFDNGFDGQDFIAGLGSHLRNLLVSRDTITVQLLETSQNLRDRYAEQAVRCSSAFLLSALELQNQCDLNYVRSSNKHLLVELCLLQICALSQIKDKSQQQTQSTGLPAPPASTPVASAAPQPAKAMNPPQPAALPKSQPTPPPASPKPYESQPAVVQKTTIPFRQQRPDNVSIGFVEEDAPKNKITNKVGNTAFSSAKLIEVWNDYAESYQSVSPSFAHAMQLHQPELKDQTTIYFAVENSLMANDSENKNLLLGYLKEKLDNSQIELNYKLIEAPKRDFAYTDREKLIKLTALRPQIQELKDQLDLEPEL